VKGNDILVLHQVKEVIQIARNWLRDERVRLKKTFLDMACELDISEGYYWLIEAGIRKPVLDLNLAKRISEVTGLTLEQIAEKEDEIARTNHPGD